MNAQSASRRRFATQDVARTASNQSIPLPENPLTKKQSDMEKNDLSSYITAFLVCFDIIAGLATKRPASRWRTLNPTSKKDPTCLTPLTTHIAA